MFVRPMVISATLIVAAGCAAKPNDIKPDKISSDQYASLSCEELVKLSISTNSDFASVAERQNTVRGKDNLSMFLVGLPLGSMADQNAASRVKTISRLKGELDAIQLHRRERGC